MHGHASPDAATGQAANLQPCCVPYVACCILLLVVEYRTPGSRVHAHSPRTGSRIRAQPARSEHPNRTPSNTEDASMTLVILTAVRTECLPAAGDPHLHPGGGRRRAARRRSMYRWAQLADLRLACLSQCSDTHAGVPWVVCRVRDVHCRVAGSGHLPGIVCPIFHFLFSIPCSLFC